MSVPKPVFYLAGKMRGEPGLNFETFNEHAERLRAMGYAVINPAETMGGEKDLPRPLYMEIDMGYIIASTGVAVIPGWEDSPGAKLEVILAHNLDKPVVDAGTLEPIEIEGYDVHTSA